MRAFSLVESLVLMVVLAAMVAVAAPSLHPVLCQGQLRQAGEQVAAFVHNARREALASGRCIRLRPQGERRIIAERLNSYDCLVDPQASPRAESGPLWMVIDDLTITLPSLIRVRLQRWRTPTLTRRGAPPPGTGEAELRLLPNGRLLAHEDGPWGFELQHQQLPGTKRAHVVLERGVSDCVMLGPASSELRCP